MSGDPEGNDPYALVLADLRAKREQIESAIAAIEALRGGAGVGVPPAAKTATAAMGPGAFLGMSIPDAARKLLAHERRQMNNSEIWEKLRAGGLHLNSAEPVNTIGSVLGRRFDKVGDVVRVGRGTWGLAEWYPNRSFKPKASDTPQQTQPAESAKPFEDDDDLGVGLPPLRGTEDYG